MNEKNQIYDVVVIGSGAGGGAAAWRLASKGLNVLLLEAGPEFIPYKDYAANTNKWERPFPVKPGSTGQYEIADLQQLYNIPPHLRSWNHITGNLVKSSLRANFGYHHVRGLGGSSLHFTGEAHRFNPRSMRNQTNHEFGRDWPINYSDIESYYKIAEDLVGVAGENNDERCPRTSEYPLPAHPNSKSASILSKAARSIGLTPKANSLAVLSRPYDGRPPCNYCGGCLKGCLPSDKGSIDVTYIRRLKKLKNCTILNNSEVIKINANATRVVGIEYVTNNSAFTATAKYFIIATGAIQTPRLLLISNNKFHPNGLANSSGQVGKNFMETLLTTVSGIYPDQINSFKGLPVNWVAWDYNDPTSIPNVKGGCRFSPSIAESDLLGPKAYATRVVEGWGKAHKDKMREAFGTAISISAIGESLPNSKAYVELSKKRDKWGLPIARINSFVDDMALSRLNFMMLKCEEIIKAAGCTSIFERFSSADAFSSTHVFGTCIMGNSRIDSVCNKFGQTHDVQNLYITDSSIFPSSGGGESPGLTIQALAIRAADNIIQRLNDA